MVNEGKKRELMVAAVWYVLSVFSVSAALNSALLFFFFLLSFPLLSPPFSLQSSWKWLLR